MVESFGSALSQWGLPMLGVNLRGEIPGRRRSTATNGFPISSAFSCDKTFQPGAHISLGRAFGAATSRPFYHLAWRLEFATSKAILSGHGTSEEAYSLNYFLAQRLR